MSVFRSGLFKGKVALVTGGGSGIGKAIATELLTLGCKVVIASRDIKKLKDAEIKLSSIGNISSLQCNIRKEEDIRNTVTSILQEHDKIDFLINNGGGQFPSSAKDISLKGWNAVIETNLTGTFLLSKEVFNRCFERQGNGAIVNIVCDMFRGFPMMSHTGAARAAVENLTRSHAIEFAESGVRVNCVAPGVIFSQTARDNYAFDVFGAAKPGIPAKRLGTPEEISAAVCFLLSPGSAFINGATLRVDAGSSLHSPQLYPISDHNNMPEYRWQDTDSDPPKSKL